MEETEAGREWGGKGREEGGRGARPGPSRREGKGRAENPSFQGVGAAAGEGWIPKPLTGAMRSEPAAECFGSRRPQQSPPPP